MHIASYEHTYCNNMKETYNSAKSIEIWQIAAANVSADRFVREGVKEQRRLIS